MPEPVTLVVGGLALWRLLQRPAPAAIAVHAPISTGASGTGPDAPLATATGLLNDVALAAAADPAMDVRPIPDLAAALDDDTAMQMRAYAALHPDDFQVFLDRYAAHLVLRQDLYLEALTDPPRAGFQLTPQMGISLGSAAYKVAQAINGVAVGRSVDVFGVAATVAGRIPGVNQDLVSSLQGLALGYRAFTAGIQVADVAAIAAANGVGLIDVTGTMIANAQALGTAGAAAPALAAMPIQSFGGVLMAAGLCLDIGFTIVGNKPDIQKAIDVALDTAALVCLFIPVIGWVIAIVIQLVKFIIDLFGEDLFGGGLSHAEREVLETARYGEALSPMFPQLAEAYTPRELFQRVVEWGSGYCGGRQIVAMSVALVLKAGDQVTVGGQPYTVPADTTLPVGAQPCYWLAGTPWASMTNDEQAWALARYASVNGVTAEAQAGIAEWRKDQFNVPTRQLVAARAKTMTTLLQAGLSLDQVDQIAVEYRAQPGLNAMATFYGFAKWQDLMGEVLADEWRAWSSTVTHGTLTDFAQANGYPTMTAFRTAALGSWQAFYDRVRHFTDRLAALEAWWRAPRAYFVQIQLVSYHPPTPEAPMPIDVRDVLPPELLAYVDALEARIAAMEAPMKADQARQAAIAAQPVYAADTR